MCIGFARLSGLTSTASSSTWWRNSRHIFSHWKFDRQTKMKAQWKYDICDALVGYFIICTAITGRSINSIRLMSSIDAHLKKKYSFILLECYNLTVYNFGSAILLEWCVQFRFAFRMFIVRKCNFQWFKTTMRQHIYASADSWFSKGWIILARSWSG